MVIKALPKIEPEQPGFVISTEQFGDVRFKRLTMVKGFEVASWGDSVPAHNFVSRLIALLGTRELSGEQLDATSADSLSEGERAEFQARFIETQIDLTKHPRIPKEPDDAYIARAIPEALRDGSAALAGASKHLSRAFGMGLLNQNKLASARLSEALNLGRESAANRQLPSISFPPSPGVKTNKLLEEVSERIGQMSTVANRTAEMQQTLNDYAANAIGVFGEAAAKTDRSANQALRIALISSALALGGIVASITIAVVQDRAATAREIAAAARSESFVAADRLLRQNQIDALNRSAAAIERQNQLAAKPIHRHHRR